MARKQRKRRSAFPLELGGGWDTPGTERRARLELGPVYLLLILLMIVAVVATLVLDDNEGVQRFGPNVATEAFGILLTVLFVRRFLDQQERMRRLRASIGALRKASRSIEQIVAAWCVLIKGVLPRRPEGVEEGVVLLAATYSEQINNVDPNAKREDGERWVASVAESVTEGRARLSQVLAYGTVLDPEYLEMVDELLDDPFVAFFARTATDPAMDARTWRVALNTARARREGHFERLERLIQVHNRLAAEAAAVRTRRLAPRSGVLGVELSLDEDLKVRTRFAQTWWQAEPRVGGIRQRSE